MNWKRIAALGLADLLGAGLVAYTVWLGNKADWTLYNLSVVGYWREMLGASYRVELIVWGVFTAAFFMGFYFWIAALHGYDGKVFRTCCVLFGLLMIAGVFLPYRPWEYPVLSDVHIVLSFASPVCLIIGSVIMVAALLRRKRRFMKPLIGYILVCIVLAACIFVRYTIITTVLEVFVVVVLLLFMNVMVLIAPDGRKSLT